jgi:O-antigen ligase
MKGEVIKRKFLVYAAAIAAIGYVFSIATGSIGLGVFIFAWVVNYNNLQIRSIFTPSYKWLLFLFYAVLLFGIFYTVDLKQGNKILIRFLPFIFYPLIFSTVTPFTKSERGSIIKIFVYSLTIFFVACLFTAIIRQIGFWGRGGIFNWYYFYRYDFLEIFKQHPTYLSAYTLLSCIFLIFWRHSLFDKKSFFYPIFFIHILAIILYGSRAGYLLLFLLFVVVLFQKLKKQEFKKNLRFLILFLFGILFCGVLAWKIPIVKERILYTFGYNYNYEFNDGNFIKNSAPEENGRFLMWQDAIDLIKVKPLLGYGTGSARTVLLEKYKKENHQLFLEKRFNAHNTYLESLLYGGIVLLLAFLAILIGLFYSAASQRSIVVFYFALIITIISLTETIFLAQGILFLSFFYCFILTKSNE